jgi:hypothetical protein
MPGIRYLGSTLLELDRHAHRAIVGACTAGGIIWSLVLCVECVDSCFWTNDICIGFLQIKLAVGLRPTDSEGGEIADPGTESDPSRHRYQRTYH